MIMKAFASSKNEQALQHASDHLKDDRVIVLKALSQSKGWQAFQLALGHLQGGFFLPFLEQPLEPAV